jgi:hypothetical protein
MAAGEPVSSCERPGPRMPLWRYRRMHERRTLAKWCTRVVATRPVPLALIGVVFGVVDIADVAGARRSGLDPRQLDDDAGYWHVEITDDDPMLEYRELMRDHLGESQVHARHRQRALRSALTYRLSA